MLQQMKQMYNKNIFSYKEYLQVKTIYDYLNEETELEYDELEEILGITDDNEIDDLLYMMDTNDIIEFLVYDDLIIKHY